MAKKSLDDLGRLQRSVLETLWELGEATVHDVRERLGGKKRPAYTTVLSVLQKLEASGWVTHRSTGRSYTYKARQSRAQAGAGALKQFVRRVFQGDAALAVQHLIRDGNLKDDELQVLREMIERKRKGQEQ